MKVKALIITALLCLAIMEKSHAFGLGAQLNFSTGGVFAPGASLLLSPNNKTHLALNWYLASEKENIVGLTLDRIFIPTPNSNFNAGIVNFTLGAGAFANVIFNRDSDSDNNIDFEGGVRIPVGININLGHDAFEIFTHVAPSFGVSFLPELSFSKPFFPIALGIRIWFR